jgi:hypothetical protein
MVGLLDEVMPGRRTGTFGIDSRPKKIARTQELCGFLPEGIASGGGEW